MSTYILVDDFVGDPQEFYNFVVEEVNRREIEGIEYDWVEEVESTKLLFNKGDRTKALQIRFRRHWINVLAYQIGKSFHVSTRFTWAIDPNKTGFLHEALMDCFAEVVDRSTRSALARHLEARSAAVPPNLNPQDVFFSPSSKQLHA